MLLRVKQTISCMGKKARRFVHYAVAVGFLAIVDGKGLHAAPIESHVSSLPELEYGTVLFDYFQKNYFAALIEHEFAHAKKNPLALAPDGEVLKGGMMLSYGMPDESQRLFKQLLSDTTSLAVSNRAWYYLAKLYYSKAQFSNANDALNRIHGDIPTEIFFDYYYLGTLIGNAKAATRIQNTGANQLAGYLPGYPYLLFNLAVGHIQQGDTVKGSEQLQSIAKFAEINEELSVLSDRAKNGLAQLALENGDLPVAWEHLKGIRTTGLYSNRALLAYAWSAVKMERFQEAIPALNILNQRSIAIPEVQETKILLAHLYEQQGAQRRALKSNILAEESFQHGMQMIEDARQIIAGLDVPREFIRNLEAIMADSDWYGAQPSVDYKKLTPFLIDLMSSNAFNEVLKELADLYAIEDNLRYWIEQSDQHRIVLTNAAEKNFGEAIGDFFKQSRQLKSKFDDQTAELRLHTLTLPEKDQQRMKAILETTQKQLEFLNDKSAMLVKLESAYKQPEHFQPMVIDHHQRLQKHLEKTLVFIDDLEPIMRKLVNLELDKHEKRMHYYWAQSRLAKARLYDKMLLSLEKAKAVPQVADQQHGRAAQ